MTLCYEHLTIVVIRTSNMFFLFRHTKIFIAFFCITVNCTLLSVCEKILFIILVQSPAAHAHFHMGLLYFICHMLCIMITFVNLLFSLVQYINPQITLQFI